MTMKYTQDHEWVQLEDHEAAVVGITLHAQDALGDVVFVDLPEVGKTYAKGEVAGVVESVKAAADVFMASSEGKGWKREDVMDVLNDPDIRFTTSPQNVMKYANFMADVGSIKLRPEKWQEMFFPEIHGVTGN